jgi:glyoxylase-like metal-dependent hydrolase (beta-lactamase superfamily II)
MRIHHLNCGLMAPLGGALFDGVSAAATAKLACHCLLVETDEGLVLVDTGFGMKDVRHPHRRLSPFFIWLDNIRFDPELTAIRQIERLGFSPRDVRHIVMTHLDFDHTGGIEDFPWAAVHVSERELDAASRATGFRDTRRYPEGHLDGVRRWQTYRPGGGRWFGFGAVRELRGLPPEILFVSLPGHTAGHCGVALDTGAGWLLHAGDAYFFRHEMDGPERRCPPATRAYQRLMAVDHELHLRNQARLRELYQGRRGPLAIFCTHDIVEFEALRRLDISSGLGARAPAPNRAAAGARAARDAERASA